MYNAIKEVAGTSYVAVFDLSGTNGGNLLFASDKYDKSDSVLRKLGIRPKREGSAGGSNEDEEAPDPKTPPKDGGGGDGTQPQQNSGGGTDMKQPR
ncbi:MAG: OmpH family outer membrane protein [Flavobacteriales bacterium]|nr:OmpH family outer membrane protein [Flavobacteriales bacterium]